MKDKTKIKIKKHKLGEIAIDEKKRKELLKQRESVVCDCNRQKSNDRSRAKYGTCSCDSYSFNYTVGLILSNALFQYIATASNAIIRDDWEIIEKHANAIKDYAKADSWDKLEKDPEVVFSFTEKERKWREAMFWLSENWESLWW